MITVPAMPAYRNVLGFMTTNDVFENCNWKISPAFTIL